MEDELYIEERRLFEQALLKHKEYLEESVRYNKVSILLKEQQNELFEQEIRIIDLRLKK